MGISTKYYWDLGVGISQKLNLGLRPKICLEDGILYKILLEIRILPKIIERKFDLSMFEPNYHIQVNLTPYQTNIATLHSQQGPISRNSTTNSTN